MQLQVFDQLINPELFFRNLWLSFLLCIFKSIDVRAEWILLISGCQLIVKKLELVRDIQLVVPRPWCSLCLT